MSAKLWTIADAIKQIEACNFECEAGPLTNNIAWQFIVAQSKVGPEFSPGQGVWFEIDATAAGVTLRQWVHFYVVGVRMESGCDDRFWTYSLSYDPPAPYHGGTTHFTGIRAERLRLSKPEAALAS